MKNLLLILTLLFSTVFFSSPSYAEWTKMTESVDGDTFYVDFERIRKHDGFVYYWKLTDYLKLQRVNMSNKTYNQGDCKLFRFKSLSYSFHKQPMGGGTAEVSNNPDKEWTYPPPKSVAEITLKQVCNR